MLLVSGLVSANLVLAKEKQDVITLQWQDLIPFEERNTIPPQREIINHDGEAPAQLLFGGVRDDLNNKLITIPGFVIPLEGDNEKITEFLLVPFFGACIHVPPPPPNQIIYVKFEHGAPIQQLWDVVNVTGVMKTQTTQSELAQTGYLLEGVSVAPFQE
ncbi:MULTISPECIES: DUF3299 domain-containing protein [unclassified Vibrio]|uniref:DUF3299 domain-containing protein n=1 Tax=Vibrio sp. HB236076 TaxID=3232307 RepID=A0AB39HJ46_9VIBR|nr:DUF3299 domain-containing protein [Vibrio sp. HB161653]MDP5253054.1 DUF3299 domain-containing protein [Vibrio sp. HB161653]